ncbi:MAG: peptidylprolyl isomerase [Candidatus Thiodiazotropha sp. (ex. Lucinoma kazani)]
MCRLNNIGRLGETESKTASSQSWRLLFHENREILSKGVALILILIILQLTPISLLLAQPVEEPSKDTHQQTFAIVNGHAIRMSTYQTMVHLGARQRFYHGQAPEADLISYRKQVGDQLIEESILHQEALRRNIEPDPERVAQELNKNIKRLASKEGWEQTKEKLLPVLREGLERHDRIRQLEIQFRNEVSAPDNPEIQSYYNSNLDKFTSPPQTRVSMILLNVPPWGDPEVWKARRAEMEEIKREITEGMEFYEAAKRYSDDSSASSGGDMGYLHKGMLSTQAESAISSLDIREISEPITLLEGVALFHLTERVEIQVNPLEKVRQRAVELLIREKQEAAVTETKKRLRESADIRYTDPEYFDLRNQMSVRREMTES